MDPTQIFISAGSAGIAAYISFWVLKQFAEGKFHSDSEVDNLVADKKALQAQNEVLAAALKAANDQAATIIGLWKEVQKQRGND